MARPLRMPLPDGTLASYMPAGRPLVPPKQPPGFNRIAYSAAHVVADPLASAEPALGSAIDWDATLAYRRYLVGLGLGIAEAMDTAQRGMGLAWPQALELIGITLANLSDLPTTPVACGVGTDHRDTAEVCTLDEVVRAYLEQLHAVQRLGGRVILMASRALARVAASPDDYFAVYSRVLAECERPAILHWLGPMFDPALAGYWGTADLAAALDTVIGLIAAHASRIDGIKISLLDAAMEVRARRRLPEGVRMYTGDDFNYPELITGDSQGHSDALLGIFDAIAPAASLALGALAQGETLRFHSILAPTVPLSRTIFRAPTYAYKTGVVFLAWLNGFQDHFVMLGGAQGLRPLTYFAQVFREADAAGLLRDPDFAVTRMRTLLALHGITG